MNYRLIAHRGYSAVAPENTLVSFQLALEEQVFGVEFDVHFSADGIPVVIHDSTLDRTTNGCGNVAEKSIAQLQSFDAGSWFDSKFARETIPSLEQVLNLFSSTKIKLFIELKSPQFWSKSERDYLIEILAPVRDRCVIASFEHKFLTQLQLDYPQFNYGYAVSNQTEYSPHYLEALNPNARVILPHFSLILEQPSLTKTLQEEGWKIVTWTVDENAIAQKLSEFGVVTIITNNLLNTEPLPENSS